MSMPVMLVLAAIALSLIMTAAWALVMSGAKSGWVDAIWTFAVGAVGAVAALAIIDGWNAYPPRQWLVGGLIALWSLRLGLHIVSRTLNGGEDPRYAALKKEWGDGYRGRLFWFLQIQAAAALVLVVTVFFAAKNPAGALGLGDFLGIAVFAAAILGEGIADAQLARFRKQHSGSGRVCDAGLWGLSRHPNYFFEWLVWVAFAVIAIDLTGGYWWGLAALAGPIFMYWLLVHVSGIPPLEQHMLRSRGDAFRAYQRRVNAFWPGPQRGPAGGRFSTEHS